MDFFEVIKKRRSIREFKDKEVPDVYINKILESAFYSPSSRGRRPWHFIVIKDRVTIDKLSKAKRGGGASGLSTAAVGIVLVAEERSSGVWIEDLAVAAEHIQLSAFALNLGALWVQIRGRVMENGQGSEDYVKEILGIPENYRILAVMAIGYPQEVKPPHSLKEVDKKRIHRERW